MVQIPESEGAGALDLHMTSVWVLILSLLSHVLPSLTQSTLE